MKILLFKKGEILNSYKVESFIYHDRDNIYKYFKKLENNDYEVIHDFALKIELIRFD